MEQKQNRIIFMGVRTEEEVIREFQKTPEFYNRYLALEERFW